MPDVVPGISRIPRPGGSSIPSAPLSLHQAAETSQAAAVSSAPGSAAKPSLPAKPSYGRSRTVTSRTAAAAVPDSPIAKPTATPGSLRSYSRTMSAKPGTSSSLNQRPSSFTSATIQSGSQTATLPRTNSHNSVPRPASAQGTPRRLSFGSSAPQTTARKPATPAAKGTGSNLKPAPLPATKTHAALTRSMSGSSKPSSPATKTAGSLLSMPTSSAQKGVKQPLGSANTPLTRTGSARSRPKAAPVTQATPSGNRGTEQIKSDSSSNRASPVQMPAVVSKLSSIPSPRLTDLDQRPFSPGRSLDMFINAMEGTDSVNWMDMRTSIALHDLLPLNHAPPLSPQPDYQTPDKTIPFPPQQQPLNPPGLPSPLLHPLMSSAFSFPTTPVSPQEGGGDLLSEDTSLLNDLTRADSSSSWLGRQPSTPSAIQSDRNAFQNASTTHANSHLKSLAEANILGSCDLNTTDVEPLSEAVSGLLEGVESVQAASSAEDQVCIDEQREGAAEPLVAEQEPAAKDTLPDEPCLVSGGVAPPPAAQEHIDVTAISGEDGLVVDMVQDNNDLPAQTASSVEHQDGLGEQREEPAQQLLTEQDAQATDGPLLAKEQHLDPNNVVPSGVLEEENVVAVLDTPTSDPATSDPTVAAVITAMDEQLVQEVPASLDVAVPLDIQQQTAPPQTDSPKPTADSASSVIGQMDVDSSTSNTVPVESQKAGQVSPPVPSLRSMPPTTPADKLLALSDLTSPSTTVSVLTPGIVSHNIITTPGSVVNPQSPVITTPEPASACQPDVSTSQGSSVPPAVSDQHDSIPASPVSWSSTTSAQQTTAAPSPASCPSPIPGQDPEQQLAGATAEPVPAACPSLDTPQTAAAPIEQPDFKPSLSTPPPPHHAAQALPIVHSNVASPLQEVAGLATPAPTNMGPSSFPVFVLSPTGNDTPVASPASWASSPPATREHTPEYGPTTTIIASPAAEAAPLQQAAETAPLLQVAEAADVTEHSLHTIEPAEGNGHSVSEKAEACGESEVQAGEQVVGSEGHSQDGFEQMSSEAHNSQDGIEHITGGGHYSQYGFEQIASEGQSIKASSGDHVTVPQTVDDATSLCEGVVSAGLGVGGDQPASKMDDINESAEPEQSVGDGMGLLAEECAGVELQEQKTSAGVSCVSDTASDAAADSPGCDDQPTDHVPLGDASPFLSSTTGAADLQIDHAVAGDKIPPVSVSEADDEPTDDELPGDAVPPVRAAASELPSIMQSRTPEETSSDDAAAPFITDMPPEAENHEIASGLLKEANQDGEQGAGDPLDESADHDPDSTAAEETQVAHAQQEHSMPQVLPAEQLGSEEAAGVAASYSMDRVEDQTVACRAASSLPAQLVGDGDASEDTCNQTAAPGVSTSLHEESMAAAGGDSPLLVPGSEAVDGAAGGDSPLLVPGGEAVDGAAGGDRPLLVPGGEAVDGAAGGDRPLLVPGSEAVDGADGAGELTVFHDDDESADALMPLPKPTRSPLLTPRQSPAANLPPYITPNTSAGPSPEPSGSPATSPRKRPQPTPASDDILAAVLSAAQKLSAAAAIMQHSPSKEAAKQLREALMSVQHIQLQHAGGLRLSHQQLSMLMTSQHFGTASLAPQTAKPQTTPSAAGAAASTVADANGLSNTHTPLASPTPATRAPGLSVPDTASSLGSTATPVTPVFAAPGEQLAMPTRADSVDPTHTPASSSAPLLGSVLGSITPTHLSPYSDRTEPPSTDVTPSQLPQHETSFAQASNLRLPHDPSTATHHPAHTLLSLTTCASPTLPSGLASEPPVWSIAPLEPDPSKGPTCSPLTLPIQCEDVPHDELLSPLLMPDSGGSSPCMMGSPDVMSAYNGAVKDALGGEDLGWLWTRASIDLLEFEKRTGVVDK